MIRNILFYTDLTDNPEGVMNEVLSLIGIHRAHLHIVHLLHSKYRFHAELVDVFMDHGMAMGLNSQILEVVEGTLRARYSEFVKGLLHVSFHVLTGVASVEVLRFIRKVGIDMVILTAEAASRGLPLGSDSILEVLKRRSPCPFVLLSDRIAQGAPGKEDVVREGVSSGGKVISFREHPLWRRRRMVWGEAIPMKEE